QSLIPFGFLHCTAGLVLFAPVFGIDIEGFSDFVSVSCSCFPPLDAIATILLMHDYREAAFTCILCRRTKMNSKISSNSVVIPANKH
ncbi:hypothetical protein PMAYCL1PPCAC_15521, partial [Pristionchus mayeri]